MSKALDRSLQRLMETFPPKHPDRSTMRPQEKAKLRRRTNDKPSVQTDGWQGRTTTGDVDWDKQDHIPVGSLDRGLWVEPPKRGQHVSSKGGRGNKGKKNSKT